MPTLLPACCLNRSVNLWFLSRTQKVNPSRECAWAPRISVPVMLVRLKFNNSERSFQILKRLSVSCTIASDRCLFWDGGISSLELALFLWLCGQNCRKTSLHWAKNHFCQRHSHRQPRWCEICSRCEPGEPVFDKICNPVDRRGW